MSLWALERQGQSNYQIYHDQNSLENLVSIRATPLKDRQMEWQMEGRWILSYVMSFADWQVKLNLAL